MSLDELFFAGHNGLFGLSFIPACRKFFQQLFESGDGIVQWFRIPVDCSKLFVMAHANFVLGVWSEDVIPMKVKKMFVFDDGFRIGFFVKK